RTAFGTALRTVRSISVPAGTRISGPGICVGFPASANAGTSAPGALSPSGCHMPRRASRCSVSRPRPMLPAARRLSLTWTRSRPPCALGRIQGATKSKTSAASDRGYMSRIALRPSRPSRAPPGRLAVSHDTFSSMPHPKFPNLTVLDHPLIQHKLSILRDKNTTTKDFKQLVNEIAMLMAYEVTKDLPLETAEVETPLERMHGVRVAGKKLALVPILRAGLGMVEGIAQLIPSARVGHIGIYREHDTLEPVDYYFKIPSGEDARDFFVLDPMLATGGSAADAVSALKHAGAQRIRFLCLVAAPEGVRRMLETHPDVPVFAAALDRELNDHGYILPGLGDAGDRLFGTR